MAKNSNIPRPLSDGEPDENQVQRFIQCLRKEVARILDSKGEKLDFSNPDTLLDSLADKQKIEIDSIRERLRTEFYLAVFVRETSPEDSLECARRIGGSDSKSAICEASDYVQLDSPEGRFLYDGLLRTEAYEKAFAKLDKGSPESISLARRIAETKKPKTILYAYLRAGKVASEILGPVLAEVCSVEDVYEAYTYTLERNPNKKIFGLVIAKSGNAKLIFGALRTVTDGSDISVSLTTALASTGDKALIKKALKIVGKQSQEYQILLKAI